jgi:hypothetical protein
MFKNYFNGFQLQRFKAIIRIISTKLVEPPVGSTMTGQI